MATISTISRPRNVNWLRAAALLYGDWGTSKAYVVGMAFLLAGYAGFWPIVAVTVLTALVGFNYSRVCKYYPDGGGVYTSARAHSKWLALVGGFLLVADYIVTAALSCLDAFQYLGVADPLRWTIMTLFLLGVLNFFGSKHSGSFAVMLALPTAVVVIALSALALPHLGEALARLEHPQGGWPHNWAVFVGLILTLSGVESIANMTGVMQTDKRGEVNGHASIDGTVQKTIWPVLIEVCVFTVLLALLMNAVPNLDRTLDASGNPLHVVAPDFQTNHQHAELEGSMLRYMGEHFAGHWFGLIVGLVFAVLLLSASNTAIVGTVSVLFMMSRDRELPTLFTSLNRFGMPWIPLLVAMIVPILTVTMFSDIESLANLYAIGVIGAITVDLGSSALNRKLSIKQWERLLLLGSAAALLGVWLTIAITKPFALIFALSVVGFGLLMTSEWVKGRQPIPTGEPASEAGDAAAQIRAAGEEAPVAEEGAILVAARGVTDTLKFAVEEAALRKCRLYVLYVRVIAVTIPTPARAQDDKEAQEIFDTVRAYTLMRRVPVYPVYTTSDDPVPIILDLSATLGVDFLILGGSQRTSLVNLIRGDVNSEVARQLPPNIQLLIHG